jgi:RNA polymerase sigma-70 factor (ECF subfamily)
MRNSPSGDDLAAAFATGDPDALRRVYDEYQRAIHSYCRRFAPENAADICQEVFLGAWRSRERFDPASGSLGGWLMGIARFKVLDHLRVLYRSRSVAVGDMEDLTDTDLRTGPDEAELDAAATRILVADALDQLGDPAATWIRAAFLDGLSHTQIAERTGTPLGTVKSTIRRGLERIRRDLEALDAHV